MYVSIGDSILYTGLFSTVPTSVELEARPPTATVEIIRRDFKSSSCLHSREF